MAIGAELGNGPEPGHEFLPSRDVAVSVVAPAYNESETLGQLVSEIVSVFRSNPSLGTHEIVIVDDGSTDGTHETLRRLAQEFESLKAIRLTRNYGQSAALAAGIDAANGSVIVTIDADLQNDPADIPRLIDRLGDGYDCVSGRRVDRKDPLGKRIPSRIQTHLAKLTGPNIDDFGCTLKAYRAEAIESVDIYGEGHRYIPAQLYEKGFRIGEIDVNHRPRKNGSSRYGAGRILRGFVDLVHHLVWNRYGARPMQFFGITGLLLMGVGVFLGGYSLIQRFVFDVSLLDKTPRLVLIALFIISGLQFVMFGLIAEFFTKMYHSDERPYRVESKME